METYSFPDAPTWFQNFSDFQATKSIACWIRQIRCDCQISTKNAKYRWQEKPLKSGRSGTHYVAMATKLLSSYCAAPPTESYCVESDFSDSNWLRYLSLVHPIWWKSGCVRNVITNLANLYSLKNVNISRMKRDIWI